MWLVVNTDGAPRSIELSDGWVACGGLLADTHVAALVSQGKIRAGSKIRVATSELVTAAAGGGSVCATARGLPPGVVPAEPCAALESAWNARWVSDAWTALCPAPAPAAWTSNAVATLPVPLLTLHANSVRPAHWASRLGPARVPHFLVSFASLVPGGGPAPALQFVVARRGPSKVLAGAPGAQRAVLSAEEADDAHRATSAAASAALETRVGALEAAHEAALAKLSRRARAARSSLGSGGAPPAGGAARSQPVLPATIYASQGFSQDGPFPASQPGASQSDSVLGTRGGEAAAAARLVERLSNSLAAARADAARGADEESRVVPFFTLSVLDTAPAHWAATGRGGLASSIVAPAARAPVSATLTVWRVSADDADAYAEGAIFTATNVGAADADPDADVPAGAAVTAWPLGPTAVQASLAAPLPLPSRTRLTTSRDTVFRSVAAPPGGSRTAAAAHDAVRAMLLSAAAGADGGHDTAFARERSTDSSSAAPDASPQDTLSAPLGALVAAAAGYSPRACVPLAHAPALAFATAATAALAQAILAAVVPPPVRGAFTPDLLKASPKPAENENDASARKRSRRRSTSSPSLPQSASVVLATSATPTRPAAPRGSTLWSVFGGAVDAVVPLHVACALARAVSLGGVPRPSTAATVDLCALVLRVSAARAATGAALRAARGPTPPVAWDVSVVDASGAVGVISFSTTLASRLALTGCSWDGARDDLPPVAASVTSHAIVPGATVVFRDVAYRYWNTHERVHRVRWVESSALAPRSVLDATRARMALNAWLRAGTSGASGAGAGAGVGAERGAGSTDALAPPPSHTAIALLHALQPPDTRSRLAAAVTDASRADGGMVAAAHRAAIAAGVAGPDPLLPPLPLLGLMQATSSGSSAAFRAPRIGV